MFFSYFKILFHTGSMKLAPVGMSTDFNGVFRTNIAVYYPP